MYGRQMYKKNRFETATQGELLVMLYDGAIRQTELAETAIREADHAALGKAVAKGLDIVAYLGATLIADRAPDLAEHLQVTYQAWSAAFVRCQGQRTAADLATIREQMIELRDAWAEAQRQLTGSGVGPRVA